MPEYDATMYVITMVLISLQRIISTVDRVTLEREHTNIIDNLNIYRISIDPDVRCLIEEVLQVISKRRLDDEIRQIIAEAESEQVRRSPWRTFIDRFIARFIENPKEWFEQPIFTSFYSVASVYQEYRTQQNDSNLVLTPEERYEYGELRYRLLITLQKLPNQEVFGLGRITRGVLRAFTEAIKFKKPLTRQTKLEVIENEFSHYAPYWFYRTQAAMERGDNEEAGKYSARFMDVWKPVLYRDLYRAEIMKYKIARLMREGVSQSNAGEIRKCFDDMRANIQVQPEDWTNNIFAGMVYFSLGNREKAEAYIKANIDSNLECEESSKLLKCISEVELPDRIDILPDETETISLRVSEPAQNVHELRPPMSDDDFIELCKSDNIAKIEEEIKNGANVNAVSTNDVDGEPVLILSAKRGHTEVVELLLKHGANVNARSNHGSTALMWAARQGYADVIEILLEHKADIEAQNNYRSTALIWGAKHGNSEAAEVLMQHGANTEARANNGNTALIWATLGNHEHVAKALIEYGADINATDNEGWNALMWANRENYPKLSRFLRTHGAR